MAGEDNVGPAGNLERFFLRLVSGLIGKNHFVWNLFDEASAKHGSGNPENHVVVGKRLPEVRLREHAFWRVRAARYGKQIVDTAVRRSVWVSHKPRLAHRPISRDEWWNDVDRPHQIGKCNLRIQRRARSTDCGLRMTTGATAKIHRRPEAVGDLFLFF